jgi:HEAT repeat protein
VRKGRETMTADVPDPVVDAVGRTLKDLHLEPEIRVTAAWILGEIGDREGLPALGACASDKKVDVKTEVAISRQKLGLIDPARPYDISPEELPFGPDAYAL